MLIKIGYENLQFMELTKEQEMDVMKFAGKTLVIYDVAGGIGVKGDKAKMFELLCNLSFKYDLEVN